MSFWALNTDITSLNRMEKPFISTLHMRKPLEAWRVPRNETWTFIFNFSFGVLAESELKEEVLQAVQLNLELSGVLFQWCLLGERTAKYRWTKEVLTKCVKLEDEITRRKVWCKDIVIWWTCCTFATQARAPQSNVASEGWCSLSPLRP